MRTCPYCGTEVTETAKFCQECGSDLRKLVFEKDVKAEEPYEEDSYEEDTYEEEPYEEDAYEEESYEEDTYEEEPYEDDSYEEESYERETASGRFETESFDQDELDEEEEALYSREGRKTLMVGVILAALICIVGIGLYFVVTNMLQQEPKIDVGSGLNKDVQVTVSPTKEPEAQQETDTIQGSETEAEGIQATVQESDALNIPYWYEAAGIVDCQESSILEDGGVYHSSDHMVDGRSETSWQEASEGDGTGEWVYFQLDRQYAIRYITVLLGNWKSEQLFYANNRPAQILLKLDDQEFYLDFPDGMRSFTVELSEDCKASGITLQILGVYDGANWSDCCISEMTVYGQ